ncbi:MAG: helix-turn-helix domain-containing protein [Myxococcaceae bacterium]
MRRTVGSALRRLAANMQSLRVRRGVTQQQLADLIDMDVRHLQRVERGEVDVSLTLFLAIAAGLQVPPQALLRPAHLKPPRPGRPKGTRGPGR